MKKEFDNLIQGTEKAEALSNRVKDWMASNISEEEFPSEAKKLNRIARELRSVQRAAGQRPSISCSGPARLESPISSITLPSIRKRDVVRYASVKAIESISLTTSILQGVVKNRQGFRHVFALDSSQLMQDIHSRPNCSMR